MTDKSFAEAAEKQRGSSLAVEFWAFLLHTKKFWLLPIIVVLLLFGA